MTFQALSDPSLQTDRRPRSGAFLATLTAGLALLFLAWEAAGGDLRLAAWAGNTSGFALRDHWFMSAVMHQGARVLAWLLALGLCAAVWWPVGPLRRLTTVRRLQLAASVLLSVLGVSVLKSLNPAACPWDLPAFGGNAQTVSHWLWWVTPEGGRGRCFPAGHASAGFAFVGGYFVFRDSAPALARRWLLIALAAGLLLGLTQQWRGAHFMSHTLWSGWVCWCLAWAFDGVFGRLAATRGART
jgi:membrane-associated PAP2 superfamily phosphatase